MSFTENRIKHILEMLKLHQRVTVVALSEQLQVSHESIRRDLKELEIRGYARRVYGGAVIDGHDSDQPFGERIRVSAREKARIGEAAASMVENGMKIFIDTGTTTLACLKHLESRRDVTIVSNSIAVAAHFFPYPDASVRVLGGRMRPEYQATYGHETVAALREHFFDLAIIAISAIHLERGFMDFGEDEAVLRRIARGQASRSIIVADSSKFGRLGSIHTFGLSEIDAVVTSGVLPKDFSDYFSQSNVDIINA
ncbi:DeoR family transcriptional regulator [Agrobacterium vitis]|uniref:DeoR/GlpR family DNA-binding transcription regulator n=1 Tax=Agrobacterium vitis TaxID=373 RepID=UPI000872681B|nr:DeoR/GlpR family DNA-binding transcription regulator [Agrobacterium vitis]MCE6078283.1 DeoR family transcriptional regulator [Agrobacterium vitis]MUO73263.1 DeoR family transcriptional regulator [Agrobacterium vitis]MUO87371.1 DeoR family transcriptional regulator [Agrobacterium vitis]